MLKGEVRKATPREIKEADKLLDKNIVGNPKIKEK